MQLAGPKHGQVHGAAKLQADQPAWLMGLATAAATQAANNKERSQTIFAWFSGCPAYAD